MEQVVCEKIDKSKLRKIDIDSAIDWAEVIFGQFGLNNYDEIIKKSKELGNDWFLYFYWSKEVQNEFIKELKKLHPKSRHKKLERGFEWLHLYWTPTHTRRTEKELGEFCKK